MKRIDAALYTILLVSGGWLFSSHKQVVDREAQISTMENRLKQLQSMEGRRAMDQIAVSRPSGKPDWLALADHLGAGMEDFGFVRDVLRLKIQLDAMSVEELVAELKKLQQLPLKTKARVEIEMELVKILAQKDPKALFDHIGSDLALVTEDASNCEVVCHAFDAFAKSDLSAASAWLDQQSDIGELSFRISAEGILFKKLMPDQVDQVVSRLQRFEQVGGNVSTLMGLYGRDLFEQHQEATAQLIRRTDEASSKTIGRLLSYVARNEGPGAVDQAMTRIQATAEEREAVMKAVLSSSFLSKKEDDLEKAQAWVAGHTDHSSELIGEVLAEAAGNKRGFDSNFQKALQLSQQNHDETVLASFLSSYQVRLLHPSRAKPLIDQIKNPELRQQIQSLPEYR
jgi:hypothetical protein